MTMKQLLISLYAALCITTMHARKAERFVVDPIEAQLRNFHTAIKDAKNLIEVDYTVTSPPARPNLSHMLLNDYDKDGIPDRYDLCPEKFGVHRRRGCPEWDFRKLVSFAKERMRMSKSDYETTINAFAKLKLDEQMNIDSTSLKELDRFIALMKRNRHWNITISSHFDQARTDRQNRNLSEQRLNAVLDHIRRKGVAGSRIKGYFFGASRPVTDLPHARFEIELNY